jgi:hypothetical protein
MRRSLLTSAAVGVVAAVSFTGAVFATPSPNGPGQPGAPGTTCGSPNAATTPGQAANAGGSPFNPSGQAGTVYAGNPGTASSEHSNSVHAVSQYDAACFQNTSNPGHS